MRVGTRDARMEYVAEDGDLESVYLSLVLTDGERVEERLRRVLVRAVAGVDDCRAAHTRQLVRRAGRRMADDDQVGGHRFEVARRVEQGLALRHARRRGADVDDVGRETFARYLE